jgi:hypothetical protein
MERDGRNDLRLETNPNGDIVSRKLQDTEKKNTQRSVKADTELCIC